MVEETAVDHGNACAAMLNDAVVGGVATVIVKDKATDTASPCTPPADDQLHEQRVASWAVLDSVTLERVRDTEAAIGSRAPPGAAVRIGAASAAAASAALDAQHARRG
jgi:hypothetical protein